MAFLSSFLSEDYVSFLYHRHSIRVAYKDTFGTSLHLMFPRNLNEKLIWLSLYYQDPNIPLCADKKRVREYVVSKCGLPSSVLVPLLEVYRSAEEIDFDKLPQRFVLKCNHGCGYNILVPDKYIADYSEIRAKLTKWLNEDYRGAISETHYLEINPHLILCEEYLPAFAQGTSIVDYKIVCLNGKPVFCHVCYNRDEEGNAEFCAFTLDWIQFEGVPVDIKKPQSFDLMIEYAKKLSVDFPFVRVDFYDVAGKLYFGEMTFTPYGNMITYFSKETLDFYGKMLKLPSKNRNEFPFIHNCHLS